MCLYSASSSPICIFNFFTHPTVLFVVNVLSYVEGEEKNATNITFPHIRPGVLYIKDSMSDILQESWKKVDALEKIRQLNFNYVNFEVGYLTHVIQNKYRKMLDRYYSAVLMGPKPLFLFDLIILLEEVEHGYFQIDHLVKMLSQVEAKYGIYTPINVPFKELTKEAERKEEEKRQIEQESTGDSGGGLGGMMSLGGGFGGGDGGMGGGDGAFGGGGGNAYNTPSQTRIVTPTPPSSSKRRPFNWTAYREQMESINKTLEYYTKYSKAPHTRWWWPMDYGWEIDTQWGWW